MFKYENMNICCTDQVTFSPSTLPKIHNFWAGGFNIKSFHITRSSCPGPLVCQGPAPGDVSLEGDQEPGRGEHGNFSIPN